MDFQEGDVGYVVQSAPHYIENTGDTNLVLLEMFKSAVENFLVGIPGRHSKPNTSDRHVNLSADFQ